MEAARINIRVQRVVVIVAVILFVIKIVAWYLTGSVAILTDALESTVNVVAGLISLYGLFVAAKPRDEDHPYGHGKAEFLSAAFEGSMITIAGLIIIYEAINNFIHPHKLTQLDYGILLIAVSAIVNYLVGWYCIHIGRKNNSIALVASGKHLRTDTWSTLAIIGGLALIYFTGLKWIDSAVAIVMAFLIIYTGYHIMRRSVAGIMDEADKELLQKVVDILNVHRRPNWIDLHNLRIIKFGSVLHLECHLTVPWYLNVLEAHLEIDALTNLVRNEFGETVEVFVHVDGCLEFSCRICDKMECTVRQHPFEKKIKWTILNISRNTRHQLNTDS